MGGEGKSKKKVIGKKEDRQGTKGHLDDLEGFTKLGEGNG